VEDGLTRRMTMLFEKTEVKDDWARNEIGNLDNSIHRRAENLQEQIDALFRYLGVNFKHEIENSYSGIVSKIVPNDNSLIDLILSFIGAKIVLVKEGVQIKKIDGGNDTSNMKSGLLRIGDVVDRLLKIAEASEGKKAKA
jgi:hypothetical protein